MPRMRRLRDVAGSIAYYLVCNQSVFLLLSLLLLHAFASLFLLVVFFHVTLFCSRDFYVSRLLLRRRCCLWRALATVCFGIVLGCFVDFAAVLVAVDTIQTLVHFCTFYSIQQAVAEVCKTDELVSRMRRLRDVTESIAYYLVCD